MKTAPTQIVLLGGGYVTVWAYRSLAKHLSLQMATSQVMITVVCPNEHHCYHGWTAESLTDIIQSQHRLSPLAELMPDAQLLLATAEELDSTAQVIYVRTADNERQAVRYDHLLVGIGSFDSEVVDGIRTHGYQIKAPEAFQRTQQRLRQLVKQASLTDSTTAGRLLSITVAGGGFAGVELVTNLAEWMNSIKKLYPSLRGVQPKIRLVNRGNQVLSALQPDFKRLIHYTEKAMDQYGIEVHNSAQLTKVTPQGAYLSDGSFLESSVVISTVGQSRFVLAGTEAFPRDSMQRLHTNTFQQVDGLPNVWGGGDACHVPHSQTGKACPTNALWAIKHGEYAGRNIARAIKSESLRPFTYKGLGQSASLGLGKGIAELYGVQLTGFLAWLMRWFFFHYFMPSHHLMLNTINDWFYLLFQGRRRASETAKTTMQPGISQVVPAV